MTNIILEDRPSGKKSVMDVYRAVLAQANSWREASKEETRDKDNREVCKALATELFTVASHLELTEEVNPTKLETHYYSNKDFPALGDLFEKNGRKWKVIDNSVLNVSTAELV